MEHEDEDPDGEAEGHPAADAAGVAGAPATAGAPEASAVARPHPVDEAGHLHLVVDAAEGGSRIDRLLGRALAPHYSRSWLSALVDEGAIVVDGRRVRTSYRCNAGQVVEGRLGVTADRLPHAQPMDLRIVHEDEALIVVDKPVGLVIHPGTGTWSGCVPDALDRICYFIPGAIATGGADITLQQRIAADGELLRDFEAVADRLQRRR